MKISREIKTGSIALAIIALAIWGYNYLKGKNLLNPTNAYYVSYENVDGIIESGYVYYRGYRVGNITNIYFEANKPNIFTLRLVMEKTLRIPIGSTVMAKSSSMIASAKDLHLVFTDTTAFHHPGDTLSPAYDPGLMGMLEPLQNSLESAMANLNITLESFNNTLNEQMQKDLQASIAALSKSLESFSNQISPNGDLGKSLAHVESVMSNLAQKNESMGAALDNIANITSAIDSANLQQTLLHLDSTLAATNAIMTKINNSEGTAGLFINDSSLYQNLAASTASLNALLTDLKEHPKRYVHFSLFGGNKKNE